MGIVDLHGTQVRAFLRELLANDVARLTQPGKALYGCMLREDAGIIDDLIPYFLEERWFRLVVNAGTREKDLAWILGRAAAFGVQARERRELAMLAVHGPQARAALAALLAPEDARAPMSLENFVGPQLRAWVAARTGYTRR